MERPPGEPTATPPPPRLAAALICASLAIPLGGYLSGLAIDRYGTLGSAALWLSGVLVGAAVRRVLSAPSRLVGAALVVCCVLIFVVAEICWLHWNTTQGEASWWVAAGWFFQFLRDYERAALVAGIFTLLGASSAYRQVALHRRLIL